MNSTEKRSKKTTGDDVRKQSKLLDFNEKYTIERTARQQYGDVSAIVKMGNQSNSITQS
jgi:hypothetical protein